MDSLTISTDIFVGDSSLGSPTPVRRISVEWVLRWIDVLAKHTVLNPPQKALNLSGPGFGVREVKRSLPT